MGGWRTRRRSRRPWREEPETGEWKFDVTGYFRAPLRFSWGPPTTHGPDPGATGNAGTQFRTPPLVPDANYIDWRYTNSMVGPWTELNFHYGNDRVKATVQIASYNVTDSGYRRLESNLGINEAFLSMTWPEFINENARLTLIAGAYTNRYGAAGRYDAGRYETYLFGRTHMAGETADVRLRLERLDVRGGGGVRREAGADPVLRAAAWGTGAMNNANQNLPAWEPYPGPVPQESTFVAHGHLGAVFKKMVIVGAHYIDVFANDNERAGSYRGDEPVLGRAGHATVRPKSPARQPQDPKPSIAIYGRGREAPGRRAGGRVHRVLAPVGDERALPGGRDRGAALVRRAGSCTTTTSGRRAATDQVTGTIDSVEVQYSFSFGQLFHYPQAFWGDGPDLIGTIFGMFNTVNAPDEHDVLAEQAEVRDGVDVRAAALAGPRGRGTTWWSRTWTSRGESFSVISPRIIFRTAFVTHEQVMIQYSRYFYGSGYGAGDVPCRVHERVAVPVQQPDRGRPEPGRRQERRADRGDHLVLTNFSLTRNRPNEERRTNEERFWFWPAAR